MLALRRKKKAGATDDRMVILVVSDDTTTVDTVSAALNGDAHKCRVEACADLSVLTRSLESATAQAVIVDIDAAPERMLAELPSIVGRFTRPKFVLLSSELRQDWLLQAMQAGARHFIHKDDLAVDLVDALARLSTKSPDGSFGSVVSVLSAGGGCGATTLAINMAHELGMESGEPSLLVDLDCAYGGAAGYLGQSATYGVADVLHSVDRIDQQLVRSSAVEHSKHVHLLASPATVDFQSPLAVDLEAIGPLAQACRTAYRHTIVDAPRVSLDVAEVLARASRRVIVAFELNVEDMRIARAILTGLKSRGVNSDRLLGVASRYRARRGASIGLSEARKVLDDVKLVALSNDYRAVVSNINLGKTLAERSPRSALRREIQRLAGAVVSRKASE